MKFYYPNKDNPVVTVTLPDSEGVVDEREERIQNIGEAADGSVRGVDFGILVKIYKVRLILTDTEWEALRSFVINTVKLRLLEFDWELADGTVKRVRFDNNVLRKQLKAPQVIVAEFNLRERIEENT